MIKVVKNLLIFACYLLAYITPTEKSFSAYLEYLLRMIYVNFGRQ